jgi:uncharacterized protein (TIGR02722 family)
MKNALRASICIIFLLAISACSDLPKVKRVDADTITDVSGNWNDTDVRLVCDSLLKNALASPRIDEYINDFSARHSGARPAIIVGRFRNVTSEHIDTSIVSGIMRSSIISSGKLDFVEGGEPREEIRGERQEQQQNASEETTSALLNETGANMMLTGTVNSIVDGAGNKMTRTYYVTATITNIETNRILWEGENNSIKKVITRSKAKI